MTRYAMVIDLRKCVACSACTSSCNAEWEIPPGQARTHARMTEVSGQFPALLASPFVTQCNQCEHPPCVEPCPSAATFQDERGVVLVDRNVCIGCGFCVEACPYEARFISSATRKVEKCDFCAPRTARGELPACVTTCPSNAKHFGDLEDRGSDVYRMVFREGARRIEDPLRPVGPNVYYLGKPEHLDLVARSFPPRESRLPAAAGTWRSVAKPLVLGAIGITFFGQAVAFFTQLHKGEDDFDE